eukprot:gene6626-8198_t
MVLAGFYMNIELSPSGKPLQFHETVYFLVVTLATVGYGDIYPSTALGQITITIALSVGAGVLIPYHISKLMEKLQQDSPFLRNLSSTSITGHVILCGDISISHLLDFLSEFYHERYGKLKKELVLLCPNPPDDKIKSLLLHPFYKNRLIYLHGSPLFEQDLHRTKLSKAEACFVSLPRSWNSGDTDNILVSYAIKSMNKNIKIFSHLLSSKNRNKSPFLKGSFCVEEFRSAVLAQSIICPGYNVIFSNLFTSRNIPSVVPQKWMAEYYYGCNHSVYIVHTPEFLVGETLSDVILSMYFGNGSLIIGLFIPPEQPPQPPHKLNMTQSIDGYSYLRNSNSNSSMGNSSNGSNSKKPPLGRGKFFLNPPKTTVLTKEMSIVIISHTVESKDPKTSSGSPFDQRMQQNHFLMFKKKFNNIFSKLAVPDLELLINEVEQTNTKEESPDQIMNESLKTFIGARSKSMASLPKQQSLVSMGSTHDLLSEELENETIFEAKDYDEEPVTPQELVKNLCFTEYGGDWIALLSDISSQKTNNPKTEKILERIKFIIDKHSLLTFTLHGKFDVNKSNGAKQMKGHMLIVCQTLRGLDLLLHHLRLPYFTSIKTNSMAKTGIQPIVVLYKEEPDDESWFETVKPLPLIAFIRGSSSNHVDLDKCGAKNAETIILTSNPYSDDMTTTEEALVDSFTLMSYVDIMKCNKNAKILIELIHEPNLRFLEDNRLKGVGSIKKFHTYLQANQEKTFMKPEFFTAPHYITGNISTYTVLDSISCQSHYHESINEVAQELIFGVNGLSQNHCKFSVYKSICNEDSKCFSRLLPLPPSYHGKTYGELFKYHLQLKNLLCLGLYRSKEPMDAPAPYVFTCPHPSTVLHENDMIYVLTEIPI